MMDKKSEKLSQDVQKKEDLIAKLTRELAAAKKQKSEKTRAYHTHQVCEMGGTTKKYLIDPDLLTKEDLDELLEYAFSKQDVQRKLKEKLRAHGWSEEVTENVESRPISQQILFSDLEDDADDGR